MRPLLFFFAAANGGSFDLFLEASSRRRSEAQATLLAGRKSDRTKALKRPR
jgi:hypothetical protein